MADEALDKIKEQLKCAICLDTYTDPKLLQCFHVYCRSCLVKMAKTKDEQGNLSVTCPICRQATPVPDNDVSGFKSAFHVNNLLEIMKSAPDQMKIAQPHHKLNKINVLYCHEHADKELEFFCESCEEVICYKCALRGGKHHEHNYEELSTSFEKYTGEIASSLEPIENLLAATNNGLTLIGKHHGEIINQQETAEASIYNTIDTLHLFLNARRTELIEDLHRVAKWRLKNLLDQQEEMTFIKAKLSSCLDFVREGLKTHSKGKALEIKSFTMKQVKDLASEINPDTLNPVLETDITFSALELQEILETCRKFGKVLHQESLDPSRSHVMGTDLKEGVVGKRCSGTLHVFNSRGEPYEEPIESLQCELVSNLMKDSRAKARIERIGLNQYRITYNPVIKGKHQLLVKIRDQHVKNSPLPVTVTAPIDQLGSPILTISEVKQPWGVKINKKGEVVVTEFNGHRVSIFSQSGEKLRMFGSHGSDRGQLKCPRGVAIDGDGNIVVVDSENHRIQKFTDGGIFIAAVGSKGKKALQFHFPKDIAFNAYNNKLYILDGNDQIQILNCDLTFHKHFGKRGNSKGQFNSPSGIACDSIGRVHVADTHNNRIQIFTAEGKFLWTFQLHSLPHGETCHPVGITIDDNNIMYVSGYHSHCISVFISDGQKLVTSIGREGGSAGEFRYPHGLTTDSCGVLYVCDMLNDRLQVF